MLAALTVASVSTLTSQSSIGREVAVASHLQDGQEFWTPLDQLLAHGERLFTAAWTIQEGGGRPLANGAGNALADQGSPLIFPRNFNRVSAPDANSCAGCHNLPYGIPGGGGDIVANVFVLGQRFDFATFDGNDLVPIRGEINETGSPSQLQSIGNSRATARDVRFGVYRDAGPPDDRRICKPSATPPLRAALAR